MKNICYLFSTRNTKENELIKTTFSPVEPGMESC